MSSWIQGENVCGCVTQDNRREKKERKMGQEIREEESLTERGILNQKRVRQTLKRTRRQENEEGKGAKV